MAGATLLAVTLAASACTSTAATRTGANGVTLRIGHTALGPVLVDSAGKTLYAFSADSTSNIVCLASCVPIWPPFEVGAGVHPQAGTGVTGSLGTVTRPDGSRQVTYNGLLLYAYAGDGAPGQTKGQGIVEQYGAVKGTWSVVTPNSSASAAPNATAPPPPTTTATNSPAAATTAPATTAPVNPAPVASTVPPTTAPPPPTTMPSTTTTAPYPTTTKPAWG